MRKIVLASASPRRRELLSKVGITFEVKPASGEERITSTEPSKVVEELSFQKAMFTAHALEKEQADDLADILIIGAPPEPRAQPAGTQARWHCAFPDLRKRASGIHSSA